ncbi:hypothetical protein IMG5_091600, partial [Ichthyophthirius multifiliis]
PNKTIIQIAFESIIEKFKNCFAQNNNQRQLIRSTSITAPSPFQEFSISCQEVPDPNDIVWLNLVGESRGLNFFRQILISIIFIFLFIFLSTPAAIFTILQKYININIVFQWVQNIPQPFGPVLVVYIPALIVVLLNQVVQLFIDLVSIFFIFYILQMFFLKKAQFQKFQRHSTFQISIFRKYYVYLLFNVIIVPCFFMASNAPVYQIITGKVQIQLQEALKRIYTAHNGLVFATIIAQSGSLTVFVYINRMGDIFTNYMSTYLAYNRRIYQNDGKSYLRNTDSVFQYGYFISQMLIILSIVFCFMLTSMWIVISGLFYFIVKHFLDSYLLLIVHQRELESSGHQ